MVLQRLVRLVNQEIENFLLSSTNPGEHISPYLPSSTVASTSSRDNFNPGSVISRLPIAESKQSSTLAARLFGAAKKAFKSEASLLSPFQERLLNSVISAEVTNAELALFKSLAESAVPPDSVTALLDYQGHLLGRLAAVESRVLDEMTDLDGKFTDQINLLSGNEEESEGLSDVEMEIESLEKIREGLEADLETVSSLKAEQFLEENDPVVLLESITGVSEDLLGIERHYLERDWDRALKRIQAVPEFLELPHIQSQLELLKVPSLENFQGLVFLQAQAELWAVTEARIEQFGQMMKTAGITDGIVNLGGLTEIDLTYAQEYSDRQGDYTRVLRHLREGKAEEALHVFHDLETSKTTRILFETIKDAEKINACTVNALMVVGSGGLARLAMPMTRGIGLMTNMSSKAIPAVQFGAQVGTFTLAHRQLNGWMMEQAFFDPNLSPMQNAEALSQEFLINAGMFAFLGMSQQVYAAVEAKALQGLAKRRGAQASQLSYGPMRIEADAGSSLALRQLQRSQMTQLTHTTGSFGTELLGFGSWDYLAANLQSLAKGDYDAKRIFMETLGSKDKWEHNLVFIAALKAGGALAAPVFRPMNKSAEGFARAKYQGRLSELDQSARDCVEALEGHLESPQDSLELLERYESALSAKAEFLRELPSELTHPAGLPMLEGEIQNIRELGRAIRAGIFDTAANDGNYPKPVPRIGIVVDPLEQAANEAVAEIPISERLPMASGEFFAIAGDGSRHQGSGRRPAQSSKNIGDDGSVAIRREETSRPARSASRKAELTVPTDAEGLAHVMRRGARSREIISSLADSDYQRLRVGIEGLNPGEAGQILRNMAKLYAEPKNGLIGNGPFQDCVRLAFEKAGVEDQKFALEILKSASGPLLSLLAPNVQGLRQEFDPMSATQYHERPWQTRLGYEIEDALLRLSHARTESQGLGMRRMLLQRIAWMHDRVDLEPLERLQPFRVLPRQGSNDAQGTLLATRNQMVTVIQESGWRRGDSPSAEVLETAFRTLMPEGDLPLITRPNSQGRFLLIQGELPIAAVISLVAEGVLPREVLGGLPVQRVEQLDGVSMLSERKDGILKDEHESFGWGDVLAFDPLSRRLVAESLPSDSNLGHFANIIGPRCFLRRN